MKKKILSIIMSAILATFLLLVVPAASESNTDLIDLLDKFSENKVQYNKLLMDLGILIEALSLKEQSLRNNMLQESDYEKKRAFQKLWMEFKNKKLIAIENKNQIRGLIYNIDKQIESLKNTLNQNREFNDTKK
jgi:hypothetical protein